MTNASPIDSSSSCMIPAPRRRIGAQIVNSSTSPRAATAAIAPRKATASGMPALTLMAKAT